MTDTLVLHEHAASGNCYKVRLTAALVGIPIERREYDILKGETRTPEFLENVNPNGRIPVLRVGDRFIPESNAACYYLADGSRLIPSERFDHADMLRWMFWEQYNHEPNIATLRFWMHEVGVEKLTEAQRLQLSAKREGGNAALKLMDDHLSGRDWFVGDGISLADICLFAYTHVAGEAEFRLHAYPHVSGWIDRVQKQPNFLPMDG
ncbi:MAG TPA: glutathione S-transferase family protein [Sphingomicrobium sp.]|nr:glutathione S-transferase family protein [Sphingomicrobium sp.]